MASTPGLLSRKNVGFSMPGHAPLYPAPPYDYQDATFLTYAYLTDPAIAAQMLPAQAALPEAPGLPGTAIAGMVFARYPSSTLGPYLEAVQFLLCVYPEAPATIKFATHLYVSTDIAMAAGREMGGYPKKIARIALDGDPESGYTASLERPEGQVLATATLNDLGTPNPIPDSASILEYLTLRLIPSPTRDAPPSLAELVLSDWQIVGGTEQSGSGTCHFTGLSADDPLQFAPILQILESKLILAKTLKVHANEPDPRRLRPF